MKPSFLFLCIAMMACEPANAQNATSAPASFCNAGTDKSAKFDDSSGFSNVALRQGGRIKVYREVASSELDWAVYDSYVFSAEDGKRELFSRAVIYAANPIAYVLTDDASGVARDNKMALPDGFYIPPEPSLAKLEDFCKLTVKAKGAR